MGLLLRLIDFFEFGLVLNCIKRLKQLCFKQRRLLRRLYTKYVLGSYYQQGLLITVFSEYDSHSVIVMTLVVPLEQVVNQLVIDYKYQ